MVKIIMHGCCGHMGQVISDLVAKDANAEIVAGIDIADKGNTTYPVFTDIKACQHRGRCSDRLFFSQGSRCTAGFLRRA